MDGARVVGSGDGRTDRWRMARWVAAAVLAVAVLAPSPAGAHDVAPTAFSQIAEDGDGVRWDLAVRYEDLARVLGVEPVGGPAATDATRAAALRGRVDGLEELLLSQVRLALDGVECDGAVGDVGARSDDGVRYALATLTYGCDGSPSGAYEVEYDLLLDGVGGDQQANLVDFRLGGDVGRTLLHVDDRDAVLGDAGILGSAGRFVRLGIDHILGGADHVLFVLALLLGTRGPRGLLPVTGAFTVAHSASLVLAGTDLVSVPAGVVEPLIALSIAVVAVLGALGAPAVHRAVVVFAFGLLHGLGFAGTLDFADDVSWRLLGSLLAFNAGIEIGQLLIVAVAFPALAAFRRLSWARAVQVGATGVIASFGVVWFVERLAATA